MRLAILADVHANLQALDAVLAALDGERPDRWIVAGDLVGYGPQPDECVARILELDPVRVAGNHDLIALGRLSTARCIPLARESLEWTAATIGERTRAALAALPPLAEEGDVVVAHGSLDDPEEYVFREPRALELLARLPEEAPGADTLVLGHTHRPWLVDARRGTVPARGTRRRPAGPWLLNPGSVGQSRHRERRPSARCAVVDDASGTVEFLRVGFDVAAEAEALRGHGLPDCCLHAPPPVWFPPALRVRRLLDRVAVPHGSRDPARVR